MPVQLRGPTFDCVFEGYGSNAFKKRGGLEEVWREKRGISLKQWADFFEGVDVDGNCGGITLTESGERGRRRGLGEFDGCWGNRDVDRRTVTCEL